MVNSILGVARRGGVLLLGMALMVTGLVLLVLPGPGLLIAALGLAVLATEFRWASRMRDDLRRRVQQAAERMRAGRNRR